MTDDKKFETLRDDMARLHNPPPETPRERMWEQIQAVRTAERRVIGLVLWRRALQDRRVWWPTAAAAILLLGVAIGRFSDLGPGVPGTRSADVAATGQTELVAEATDTVDSSAAPAADSRQINQLVYQLAASDLFARADALLTGFKTTSCTSTDMAPVPEWAGGMLLQTRLLMGSPVAEDTEMLGLLEDLELVLAQIVGISRENCTQDMAWIRKGLENRSTLDRLRLMSSTDPLRNAL